MFNDHIFLKDFGVIARFGEHAALVILDAPGGEIFSGMQQRVEYAMTFRSADLPYLSADKKIEINGENYRIRQITPLDDGVFSQAMLKK